jgi:hypothetical protein
MPSDTLNSLRVRPLYRHIFMNPFLADALGYEQIVHRAIFG